MKAATALAAAALVLMCAGRATAALNDTVNWARSTGCATGTRLEPLHEDARLVLAAQALSRGAALHSSIAASGYPATHSSVVHLSGDIREGQVSASLVAGFCALLTDSALRDVGIVRRGGDVWMVVAAPLWVPEAKRDGPAFARQVFALVNEARAAGHRCGSREFGPAAALSPNEALRRAAAEHAHDMAEHGVFDHRGDDGSTPAVRVMRANYGAYRIVGENIAAGSTTAAEVVQGWLASPRHCENIMDPRFAEMGVAFEVNVRSHEVIYWTQDFARRQ